MASNQTKIIKALLAVQGEIKNPPNTAVNPFVNSKYAPLSEVLNLVRPILTKNEIVLVQDTGVAGEHKIYVQTKLLHPSGESIISDKLVLKPDRQSPQGIGGAITYGRRYQLSTMLGIASEDDNDGAMDEPKDSKYTPQPGRKKPKSVQSKSAMNPDAKTKKPAETPKKKAKTAQSHEELEQKKNKALNGVPVIDMTKEEQVNLQELKGINDELDKWINRVEGAPTTIKEVCTACQEMLGKQEISPNEFRKVKQAMGMDVKL